MITGGRIPSIRETSADEFGLRSMVDIDMRDLRMSSKMWENEDSCLVDVPMGKFIEHTSMHGTDPSDDENAESLMKMFVNLPVEVITQGVSMKQEELSKFFNADYFKDLLEEKIVRWQRYMLFRVAFL